MIELAPALMLGLAGSLHCVGMCGPLLMALPPWRTGALANGMAGAIYHTGRLTTYGILGLLFGLAGQVISVVGIQRWVSITAGVLLLLALFATPKSVWSRPVWLLVNRLKAGFGALLHRKTLGSMFLLGMINGCLPCGLVYVACAGAVTTGSVLMGTGYMLAFGLGTLPLLTALSLPSGALHSLLARKFQKLIPACMLVMGVLLIVRGLALGIPYLSPDLEAKSGAAHKSCCPAPAHQ